MIAEDWRFWHTQRMADLIEETRKRLEIYCLLMEEVRVRFNIINDTYQNAFAYPDPMVREICYLQFRFICEIIALGCLVAHGEIEETDALKKTYEPGKILKRLETLNPHFYPQPMDYEKDDEGVRLIGRMDKDHLTQEKLPRLWGKAGDILHRTPMVKMYKQMAGSHDDFSDIFEISNQLTNLLNPHWITLIENKKGMFVTLKQHGTARPNATMMDFSVGAGEVETHSVQTSLD